MSHGKGDSAEPDLVPLLDVVLQLVMFFILTANFVMEDVDREINLPTATQAKSFDAKNSTLRFVSVRPSGEVRFGYPMPTDQSNAVSENEVRTRFETLYKIEKANSIDGKVNNPIAIRADKRTRWEDIYVVMKWARNAGFKELRLRVMTSVGE